MAIRTVKLRAKGKPAPTAQPVRRRMPEHPRDSTRPAQGYEVAGRYERDVVTGSFAYQNPPKMPPHIELGGVNGDR